MIYWWLISRFRSIVIYNIASNYKFKQFLGDHSLLLNLTHFRKFGQSKVVLLLKNYHQLGGLSNRNLFLPVLKAGSQSSRCQQGWFLLRTCSLVGRQLPSHLTLLTWSLLCACASLVSGCVSKHPLLTKTPVILAQGRP